MFASPRTMPPLASEDAPSPIDRKAQHIISTSDYGARRNHPTTYEEDPAFKGPIRLDRLGSPDLHRNRIRKHYLDDERLRASLETNEQPPTMGPSTPTGTILKSIADHLALRDAPVDAKEVAESMEFYLRCGKRLFGAARRVVQNSREKGSDSDDRCQSATIAVHDLCSGHGLTGLLFLACNPPGRIPGVSVKTVLVDQFEPKSHAVLRGCISEICPWVSEVSVAFETSTLEDFALVATNAEESDDINCPEARSRDATIVISTHACGSLTDQVLKYATGIDAASLAVMPCCYTGTDSGVPYGVRRMLGVSLSADVRRCFYLQNENDYHVDFAAIPSEITPMNRIIVAERRK